MVTVTVELPDDLADVLGSPESLAAQAKQSLVLELLHQGRISQGKAANLLGISRWEMLELIAQHRIVSGPLTAEEAERDVAAARRGMVATPAHAGG